MTSLVARLTAAGALATMALTGTNATAQVTAELRLVVPHNSAATGPIFEAAAAAFEAENPGIRIQIDVVPWDRLFQTLTADISDGTPPDLAIVGTHWLVDLVADSLVEPLDGHMTDDFKALFIPGFLTPSEIAGRVWGLPVAASARALYYNRDLFDQAGIGQPPASWEDLEEAAAAIARLGDTAYGFGLQGEEIETDIYFYHAMWAHGAELIEDDGTSGLDNPGAIAAAELIRRLIDNGMTQPNVAAYSREDVQDLFKAGRVGMMIAGPWLRDELADEAPELNWGVAPIPAGTHRATYGVTDSMMMFASSAVKDEAWRFMAYLFQPRWRMEITGREGFLPTTVAVAESELMTGDPTMAVFAAMLPSARFLPAIANWEEIADITTHALRQIYLGEADAEAGLSEAAAQIDAILDQ